MTSPKNTPKDAQVMAAILKDMGITEYEPRVINQMLEFTYRYITNILDDARLFSSHAKKKNLDIDDVKLAIQMQMDKSFTTPPPRDILIDISRQRNNMPLPLIKPHCGPRLPPDRYCLSACNYRMKSSKKPRQIGSQFGNLTAPKINISSVHALGSVVGSKLTPAVNLTSKTGATLSLVGKGASSTSPTVTVVTRPAALTTTPTSATATIKVESGAAAPSPIIKLTSGTSNSVAAAAAAAINTIVTTTAVTSSTISSVSLPTSVSKAPPVITRTIIATPKPAPEPMAVESSLKRKREDDNYDVE